MSAFWVTFRISEKTVGGRTYEARYTDLVNTVHAAAGGTYWQEPTSFLAFESIHPIETLAARFKSKIAPSHDLFLLRQMDVKDAMVCGQFDDQDIFKLMPYLKKA
jgi:hypothetical protein